LRGQPLPLHMLGGAWRARDAFDEHEVVAQDVGDIGVCGSQGDHGCKELAQRGAAAAIGRAQSQCAELFGPEGCDLFVRMDALEVALRRALSNAVDQRAQALGAGRDG